ncbi:NYN domain-containing protein [bacterium]|nr:NYN domain-containing protein [bacterium]
MRTCVFVDGENFRHSIVDLFRDDFHRSDYLPKKASWDLLFDWIVGNTMDGRRSERIRTYWYVVERIEFWPWHIEKLKNDPTTLLKVLKKDADFKASFASKNPADKDQFIEDFTNELIERKERMTYRSDSWQTVQTQIALTSRCVEFRRAGSIKYNLFTQKLSSEKAVDVNLATDLISLRDIYDLAIIVSGDQDYVPAVKAVKDAGKRVVNVSFRTRSGKALPGGARRLNEITDWCEELPYAEFKQYLNL